MAKGPSKSTQIIERLLQERRQYLAWLARIDAAADATPEHVRTRVRSDYAARLAAVTTELKTHAEAARQFVREKKEALAELNAREQEASERLSETELRHAVGEYDEEQWTTVHKDGLAKLVTIREQRQAIEADIEKLEELDRLVRAKPNTSPPPAPPPRAPDTRRAQLDELAFLKSVTEDERSGPSPGRASGANFQPAVPDPGTRSPRASGESDAVPADDEVPDAPKTLKCRECGAMNQPTDWYCEQCGSELAAL